MTYLCLYFQVHQPKRLRKFNFFDIGGHKNYEDEQKNCEILLKVAKKCYLPTNELLHTLINRFSGQFKISFSLTGTLIEQLKKYSPETLDSFKKLVDTGAVEILNETYNHSLSSVYSKNLFIEEIEKHKALIKREFGQTSSVFRNTELIYNNELGKTIESLGYRGLLAEGADKILNGRSPNFLYKALASPNLKILLRNYPLSDDIAFRFSNRHWSEYPLTAEKFSHWLHSSCFGDIINLFMDYETFGEHQWEDTGIFQFLENFPETVLNQGKFSFVTPNDVLNVLPAINELDAPHFYSWADTERDLTAWIGNHLQEDALSSVYALENDVRQLNDEAITNIFHSLLTSDHFYYMCTKWHADGDVHKYFNAYENPYDAFLNFQNIVKDFTLKVKEQL